MGVAAQENPPLLSVASDLHEACVLTCGADNRVVLSIDSAINGDNGVINTLVLDAGLQECKDLVTTPFPLGALNPHKVEYEPSAVMAVELTPKDFRHSAYLRRDIVKFHVYLDGSYFPSAEGLYDSGWASAVIAVTALSDFLLGGAAGPVPFLCETTSYMGFQTPSSTASESLL